MKKSFRVNLILIFIVPMDLDVKMKAVSLAALFLIVSFTLNTMLFNFLTYFFLENIYCLPLLPIIINSSMIFF